MWERETFWAACRGCDATIVATVDEPSDQWHKGWKMDEDCDLTMVRRIMES